MSTISRIYNSYSEALSFSKEHLDHLYQDRARNADDFYSAFFHNLICPVSTRFADPASCRTSGHISPLVSFIFDEADEFIPGAAGPDSQKASKAAAMTLARRGRKFGLGIATQRIRYLGTSIIAQPHTYFVSKLPRLSDRQAVGEAFGISEDMFRQTFKFKKGNWLLASYDAAVLEAIPIPVHAENADDRILDFISQEAPTQTTKEQATLSQG